MNYIKDDCKYVEFLKKYFPYSNIIQDTDRKLIYLRVCENNLFTEIYISRIVNYQLQCELIFLKKYREQFNKLLIYIALNEPSGIEFCIRSTIEYILKFFYSIYFDKKFEMISKTSFRNIKDDFNKLETHIFIDKTNIELLLSDYGAYSNSIHGKEINESSSLEYMENIITLKNNDLKKIDKVLIRILNNYEKLMNNILKIHEINLSTAESIKIIKTLPKKRVEKIQKFYFINKQ
ncbi:hypothetical protein [Clostridium neonatale]|uniref:hypothetical protein n=1 Tax=Clostridium neonatale TaxID=137838 RepID=UPI00291B6818|nr:conserved hypothetical protein [Clostridium neonatale]